jgi:carbonic anhydrase
MDVYENLLSANKAWVAEKLGEDPGFFERLVHAHQP